MNMKRIGVLGNIVRRVASTATSVLAGIALYYIFFLILPFFLLGLHRYSRFEIGHGGHGYEIAFGLLADYIAIFVTVFLVSALPIIWLLASLDLAIRRRWVILAILLIAPLPVAYAHAGPYAGKIAAWILTL